MCYRDCRLPAVAPDKQLHRLTILRTWRDPRRAELETTHAITFTGYRATASRGVSNSATALNPIPHCCIRPTLPAARVADAVSTGGGCRGRDLARPYRNLRMCKRLPIESRSPKHGQQTVSAVVSMAPLARVTPLKIKKVLAVNVSWQGKRNYLGADPITIEWLIG
jgi:hypothetical protein